MRVTRNFTTDYSVLLVTDASGQVRCASLPSANDTSLGDRQVFKTVRDTRKLSIGTIMASRFTRNSIVPLAVPVQDGDRFLGMCAIGLSIKAFDLASAESANAALVDSSGVPLGGRSETSADAAGRPLWLAKAISDLERVFTDYGQNGQPYEFHVLPLVEKVLFTVAAVPIRSGLEPLLENWGSFALIVLFLGASLVAVAIGADRWCVRPLNYPGFRRPRGAGREDRAGAAATLDAGDAGRRQGHRRNGGSDRQPRDRAALRARAA